MADRSVADCSDANSALNNRHTRRLEKKMSTNVVNLDALIPRSDFRIDSDPTQEPRLERIDIRHLEDGFFLNALRKPDFQRETARWSPNKVLDLIRTFLDGELIPAVIFWQSGKYVFVVDGAHRMSALISWVHDDYGDRRRSLELFESRIPEEQLEIAEKTRKIINSEVGCYAEYQAAIKFPGNLSDKIRDRVCRLGYTALVAQWVPAGDAEAAENSFFKINQAATPIDPTERRILKARYSANAIAARAIVRGGTGHKYWSKFPKETQVEIEETGKQVYESLYEPAIGKMPIKTLDLPVAGRGYNALPFVFDFVNMANEEKIADSTRKKNIEDDLPTDSDGEQTLRFLRNTHRVLDRITGSNSSSLGLHPIVYFYTKGGMFQPSAFLATVGFVKRLANEDKLLQFTKVRSVMEDFLFSYKHFITEIVHEKGSGNRNISFIEMLLNLIFDELSSGSSPDALMEAIEKDKELAFLVPHAEFDEKGKPGRRFSRGAKSASFVRDAIIGALRCELCGAVLHKNSMQSDHVKEKCIGGSGSVSNSQWTHPYCNSVKRKLLKK